MPLTALPLLWISLAFLAGILLGSAVEAPAAAQYAAPLLGAAGLCLAASLLTNRLSFMEKLRERLPARLSPLLLAAFLLAGAGRFLLAQPAPGERNLAQVNGGGVVQITGVLVEPPDARDAYTQLRLRAETLRAGGDATTPEIPVEGLLLARVPNGDAWRYGDRVQVTGKAEAPPEDEGFSYRDYLARQGIYTYLPYAQARPLGENVGNPFLTALYAFQGRALATVEHLFPPPESPLLAGILLGVETGIPATLQEAFKSTGTAHIIAISGFNIAILAGLFAGLFSRLLGRRWGFLAAVAAIALYTALVGGAAAVVRAAIMGALALFAQQLGRRGAGLNTLVFTAALMCAFNPSFLWDVGFQLSFMATLGLVLYAEPLQAAFLRLAGPRLPGGWAQRLAGPLGEYFLFTLAAQITTLPVMLYHFQRVSRVAVLANPLVLPPQPAVMILGGLATLLGMLWLPLGQAVAGLAWPLVAYTIRAVELLAAVPSGALATGGMSLPAVVAFYALLLGLTFKRPDGRRLRALLKPAVLIAAAGLLAVLVWRGVMTRPDGRLHVTLLEAGAGDSVLVQTPGGAWLLVNGGSSAGRLGDALGRRLPPFDRRLDYLVVTSTAKEDLDALPGALERFPAQAVLWAGDSGATRSAALLQQALTQAGTPITPAQAGQALALGSGVRLSVLSADENGAALLLEWGNFRMFLPGGCPPEELLGLAQEGTSAPVTALLLAQSGSAGGNPPEWIAALDPQVVLLSASADGSGAQPDAETLQAVAGHSLLRTDRHGWIEITTDGKQMWVEVEKK